MKDKDKLLEQLLELNIKNSIKDSNTNIRLLDNRIKFYQTLLNNLENNKPLFFRKKKLIAYENKKKEYNAKINELYIKIEEELRFINCIYNDNWLDIKIEGYKLVPISLYNIGIKKQMKKWKKVLLLCLQCAKICLGCTLYKNSKIFINFSFLLYIYLLLYFV